MIGKEPPENLDTVTQRIGCRAHRSESDALAFDGLAIGVERGDGRLVPAALQLQGERHVRMEVAQRAEGCKNDAFADVPLLRAVPSGIEDEYNRDDRINSRRGFIRLSGA